MQVKISIMGKNSIIPEELQRMEKSMKGGYVLEFYLLNGSRLKVGKLGKFYLEEGYYYYAGSAMGGLRGRLSRHLSDKVNLYWHIDYFTDTHPVNRLWYMISETKIESRIADMLGNIAEPSIPGFGCGDSPDAVSHLFYSKNPLKLNRHLSEFKNALEVKISMK
jgi:Uri superfamily endonuclease